MSRSAGSNFRWSLLCVTACGLLLAGWSGFATAQEVRTWSDASGKFKIKGTFKGEKDGVVTIEQEDGEEIEVETKKLSSADQRLILVLKKEVSDNPFKKKKDEDPFKPKGKSAGTTGKGTKTPAKTKEPEPDEPAPEAPDSPLQLGIRWNNSQMVIPGLDEGWKVEIPAKDEGEAIKLKNVGLPPKTDFFDKLTGVAIDPTGRRAVVTYQTGGPRGSATTRAVLCNLETGKAGTMASTEGEWVALALHEDGQRIVVRSNKFGFGNNDRLEVWTLQGSRVAKHLECVPFADVNGGDKDLMWAEFVDANRLAISGRGGRVGVLDFPDLTVQCYVESVGGAVPTLSPNRKLLAFSNGDSVCLLDLESKEVVAKRAAPSKLQWPYLAFSPTGKRLGCVAFDRALCWDVATGDLVTEIPSNGSHFHDGIAFPDDQFLFCGNNVMLDLENQLQLWSYTGSEASRVVGDTMVMAVTDGNKPGLLMNGKLPHRGALDMLAKAKTDPNLFVFKEGASVTLNLAAIADQAARDNATKALTSELKRMKCTVVPNSALEIRAKVTGPTSRQVSYFGRVGGTYTVQEWISTMEFVFEGKVVWSRGGGSNVPGFVSLKQGETMEAHLRSCEKPSYFIFERPVLPKFIQRPAAGDGPTSRMTLGQSQISTNGFR